MATPIKLPFMNTQLEAPNGMGNCAALPVHTDGSVCISVWKLTPVEIVQLLESGCVALHVFSGKTQPPVAITGVQDERNRELAEAIAAQEPAPLKAIELWVLEDSGWRKLVVIDPPFEAQVPATILRLAATEGVRQVRRVDIMALPAIR